MKTHSGKALPFEYLGYLKNLHYTTQNTQNLPKKTIKKSWRLCVNSQCLYSTSIATAINIAENALEMSFLLDTENRSRDTLFNDTNFINMNI